MLIDLLGPWKWDPKSAVGKAKGKPVLRNLQRLRNWLAQTLQQKSTNVELMIEGLVECLFKKQLNAEILSTTTDLMSTKPRTKMSVYS